MSVAYIVLAHRAPAAVARLAERLLAPEDHLILHVDRRVEIAPFARALEAADPRGQVQLARRRLASRWASFALVEATLAALEQAIETTPATHVCLLSGDSYPLASATLRQRCFDAAGEHSFLFHQDGSQTVRPDRSANATWYWNGDLRRATYHHLQIGDRQLHLPNRFVPGWPRLAPPADLSFHHGSQWWALSRAAARFCVESFIRRPELRRYFRRVQAPDEWVFPMLLASSPLAPTIVNEDLHFIRWENWHAATLRSGDLTAIRSAPKLFARKLDPADREMTDALDGLIAERDRDPDALLARLSERWPPAAGRAAVAPPPAPGP